jgi:RNA polymerase sigma factor (sigma-70 family)
MPLGAPSNARGRAGRLRPRTFLRAQRDERLVARLRAGDERAFEVLVDRYRGRLLGFCRGILGSNEDAEDVLQEVFVAAHDAIMADEREIHVRPWLYRIARNRCLNHLRRHRPETNGPLDEHLHDNGVTTADEAERRQELRDLVAGIRALPETQRNALLLRELEALSYDEIAASLDTTVPAVKSLLVRARISLARARRNAARGVAAIGALAPVLRLRRVIAAKLGIGGGAGTGAGSGGTMAAAGAGAISTKAAAVAVSAALVGGGAAAVSGTGAASPGSVVAAVTGSTEASGGTRDGGAPAAQATSAGDRERMSRSGVNEGERANGPGEHSDSSGQGDAGEGDEAADPDAATADQGTDAGTFSRRERFLALRERDPEAARRLWLRIRRYREREQTDTYDSPSTTEAAAPGPRPRPRPAPAPRPRTTPHPRPRPTPPPPPREEPPPPYDEAPTTG